MSRHLRFLPQLLAAAAVLILGAYTFRSSSANRSSGMEPPGSDPANDRAMPAVPAGLPTIQSGNACPLNRSQERRAMEAFKKLLPVVQHPRCANCHGGVDPFVDQAQGMHGGGKIDSTGGFLRTRSRCEECHGELPGWELPVLPEMAFAGKSARELCMLFKKMKPVPSAFVAHMDNDQGGVQFTTTAYKGDRALNDMARDDWEETNHRRFVNEPPPGTHAQMVADAQAWVDAMGAGWQVLPDCGCKPHGSAWEGTVKMTWHLTAPEIGTVTETADATVRFVIDPSFDITDDPATYWMSVGQTLKWTASNVGGQCRINASGSLPVIRGADENPLAILREEPDAAGVLRYSVALGPWPDQYQPIITWDCPEHDLQAPMLSMNIWWSHEMAGMVSPDGETLKGTYHGAMGPSTAVYTWDLKLVP